MAKFAVIIPAAGNSSRFQGFRTKKPFIELEGRPVWLRTVDHFIKRDDVSEVVLVLAASDMDEFHERFKAHLAFLDLNITAGGDSRAESVQNGINALTRDCDYIAVHDAARPLLTDKWVSEVFAAAEQKQAVIPATPVSSTVKKIQASGAIETTVDRSQLVLAQTPQVFCRDLLKNAYAAADNPSHFTDEASLVEASGQPVYVCDGWPMNIKITTREDFDLAKLYVKALPSSDGLSDLLQGLLP